MSEAQTADSRARHFSFIDPASSARFRLSQGMLSGRCAPENVEISGGLFISVR
jgi:hypothetical protein